MILLVLALKEILKEISDEEALKSIWWQQFANFVERFGSPSPRITAAKLPATTARRKAAMTVYSIGEASPAPHISERPHTLTLAARPSQDAPAVRLSKYFLA